MTMLADPVIDPLLDPLDGVVPTWRLDDEPIYLLLVAELGKPGTLLGPAPSSVVAGELADPDDDVEEFLDGLDVDEEEYPRAEAPPTVPIPIRQPAAAKPRKRRQPTARRAAS